MLKIKEAIIVEGRYDRIKLINIVDTSIIETGGFRIFKDKEKRELIKLISEKKGIIVFTDSDSAGFVIRNFLKGVVPCKKIKHAYIPEIKGKEKRKSKASKENILGVEGVTDDVFINALKRCGATIIGEESEENKKDSITLKSLYSLGLTGRENSAEKRAKLLEKLKLPKYLTTKALITALNLILDLDELKKIMSDI